MNKMIAAAVAGVTGFLFLLTIVFGSWFTIDQGERGVVLRNGAIVRVVDPGLGFKMPFFDGIRKINVQSRTVLYENVAVYSRDQQTAILAISVNYRINDGLVAAVYENYGGEEEIVGRAITPFVSDRAETVFGQFNAVSAITERERLTSTLRQSLAERINSVAGEQLLIESVQIGNIDFSDAYEESIEQRMQAEVEVQRIGQNLEREKVQATIAVTQAQAQADATLAQSKAESEAARIRGDADAYSRLAKARSEAESTILLGDAEAHSIRVRGDAMRQNPSLVGLVTAERWNGQLPTTMVPDATLPFLSMDR